MNSFILKIIFALTFWANLGTVGNLVFDRYLTVFFSCFVLLILFLRVNKNQFVYFKKINIYIFIYCIYNAVLSFFSVNKDLSSIQTLVLNTDIEYSPASAFVGMAFALKIISLFLVIEYSILHKSFYTLLKVFFSLTMLLLIINDVLVLVNGVNFSGNGYFLGNKFQVVYMHYFAFLFYTLKKIYISSLNATKCYLFIFWVAAISILLHCTTTLLGSILLMLFFLFRTKKIALFYNPNFTILLILFTASFFWLFSNILDNSYIHYFLVDILGKDPTLTGRIGIYALLDDTFLRDTVSGVGLENSHFFMSYLFGAANTQNGLFEVWVEQGLIGALLFLSIIYVMLNSARKNEFKEFTYPIVALMYVFILLGTVEITFGYRFCILLSFLVPVFYTKKHF
ncbi:MAG TPA: hypothetical protein K8V25_04670 [Megamonas hypermegale]|nr:hypothetical protein [Megamonas hypermegale]